MTSESQDSIRIAGAVGPGNEATWRHEMGSDATIEQLDVRIYTGAELDLRVSPFVEYGTDQSNRLPLIKFAGDKDYVDGEGDSWEFPISEGVERSEFIGVSVENVDDSYTYDFAVDFVVDRAGGTSRFGALKQLLGVV
jgi:hypothetical protein